MFQRVAEHVPAARAAKLLGVVALLAGIFHIDFQQPQVVLRAHEVDAHGVDIDALEQGGHVVEGFDVLGAEAQRGGAALHGVHRHTVGLHHIRDADVLAHLPLVAALLLAARVGFLARVTVQIFKSFQVLGAVVGLHLEAFQRAPYEFLLVVGTFEVFVDYLLPFLGRDGREFAK